MRLINRGFPAHWKLPVISVAVIAAIAFGLAITLPFSTANAHQAASSNTAPPGQPKRSIPGAGRPARSSAGCLVTYTASNWPGAFRAEITIDNEGATSINGWKLTFAFPGDEAISSSWNAAFTQTGPKVSATNTNYDAIIVPGARQSLGFLGAWTSNDTPPASFRVNGAACS